MRLWRLSSLRRARDFDGGLRAHEQRPLEYNWRPLTYCSTVPSLTGAQHIVSDLPSDWASRETHTQSEVHTSVK